MKRTTEIPGEGPDLVAQIEKSSEKKVEKRERKEIDADRLIPTGSTLLNCACSDSPWGGFGLGKIVNLIGDSSAGKTLLALTMFAEVCQHRRFSDYRLILDDAEHALEFDLEYAFGKKVARRIESPRMEGKKPLHSRRVEDFQDNVLLAIKGDRPFIYTLDSFDAIGTKEEEEKAFKRALAAAKTETQAKEIKDAHKAKKAQHATALLRLIDGELKDSSSTLIVISQVRDLIGALPFQSKKTRSGGHALRFYSTHELWMSIIKKIQEEGKGKMKQQVGIDAEVYVSKNKLTGKRRKVPIRIWDDYGMDDLSVNIDYLISEGYWQKESRGNKGTFILANEDLDIEPCTKEDLIGKIERMGLEREIQKLVGQCWMEIEKSLQVDRKPRYE